MVWGYPGGAEQSLPLSSGFRNKKQYMRGWAKLIFKVNREVNVSLKSEHSHIKSLFHK